MTKKRTRADEIEDEIDALGEKIDALREELGTLKWGCKAGDVVEYKTRDGVKCAALITRTGDWRLSGRLKLKDGRWGQTRSLWNTDGKFKVVGRDEEAIRARD